MADIEVAMGVIAAISRLGLPAPSILWDIEAVHEAVRKDGRFKTFISVGLCSNVFSTWAANERSNRLVRIDSADTIKVGSRIDADDDWTEFKEKAVGTAKYGLITRFFLSDGKSVMIIGGVTAEGSTMMSSFLSGNWQSLAACRDPHTKSQIGGCEFSAVLEARKGGVEVSDIRVRRGPASDNQ
jgi:hypothetical protein